MTVYLMTGTPGSGKSLAMAKDIYWHVKMKRPVVANFEIDSDMFKDASSYHYIDNSELCPKALEEFALRYWRGRDFVEGGIKLYIDEAQVILSSRQWKDEGRQDWVRFFTQHRKYGYDVYLVAQFHEMLDKQIRTLVEYEISHRKVNNVGLFGAFVNVLAFGHPVVCQVTRWYGQRMRLGSAFLIGTRKYYAMYNTLKIFNPAPAGGEGFALPASE